MISSYDHLILELSIETWLARRRSAVVSGPAAAIIVGSFFLFSAIMHKRPRLCGFILGARGTLLQCGLPGFAGANANRVGNRINENLAVADLAGLGRFHDDINDLVAGLVGHHDLDLPYPQDRWAEIEILRGAGSTYYGLDAIGGAVNFITGRPTRTNLEVGAGPAMPILGIVSVPGS